MASTTFSGPWVVRFWFHIQHAGLAPGITLYTPLSTMIVFGVITPSSRAAAATAILKVDPGGIAAWMALLYSGRGSSGSLDLGFKASQSSREIPVAKRLGS